MVRQEDERPGHRKQLVTDIRFTFADNPRRGRGGRGRGGFRGEGGRGARGGCGGFAQERNTSKGFAEAAPNINYETDFPSLFKLEA